MMIFASRPITLHGPASHGLATSPRHVTTQKLGISLYSPAKHRAHALTYV